ncbi:hypothetical protein B7R54_04995 [Subtercola boreus]|uniref:Spermine synthase n=1 Tax=Subtercola boreus TaxID=120213 RepID=A0A3E0VFD2_9MICO|nr:hypothetical protein [Subtercola boreus]RFA08656.1 hypothetical protein B7R54_04995 [Subtercola boreus]TQL54398.1 spermidine synthase [Subtercola boreus]
MATDDVVYRSLLGGQQAEISLVDAATRTFRLTVDGVPQSQVCLADPALVDFDYVRHIARLIDAQAAKGVPLTCAHLGGGALTLPRYVGATRPGSVQYVVESEAERTTDLLGILPLPEGCDVRFLFGDAREIVDGNGPRSSFPWRNADVTVVDLWAGSTVVSRVASLEFYARLARICSSDGVLAVNLPDGREFHYTRGQAAALSTLFAHVAVATDGRILEEPLLGNVLVIASNSPLDALEQPGWPVGDHNPPYVLIGDRLRQWIAGAPPLTDSDATDSPSP